VSPRRYARPRIHQRRTLRGRPCYVFDLRCSCGWSEIVGGNGVIAQIVADRHWVAVHRHAWKRPR
jgi:hypothetical protein